MMDDYRDAIGDNEATTEEVKKRATFMLSLIPHKSAWTENDRIILEGIIDEIEANKNRAPSYDLPVYDKYLNWLKFLKKKIINE